MLDFIDEHYEILRRIGKYSAVVIFIVGDFLLLSVLGAKMSSYHVAPDRPTYSTIGVGINTNAIKHDFGVVVVSAGKAINSFTNVVASGLDGITSIVKNVAASSAKMTLNYQASTIPTPALAAASNMAGSFNTSVSLASFITPKNDTEVPIIKEKTSSAALAKLNERERQKIIKLINAQATANEELGGLILAGDPNHGGYPAKWDNIPQDSALDRWGMYNRECVSYAAWKVYQTYGHMPYWGGVGNANEWLYDARRAGIPTGSTPKVHSVAISMRGYYGHAAWVEKVRGDEIYVSQYNYDLAGHYSEMWVSASYFSYIYFN